MYICICNAVTDREIHACVRDGARTLRDVSDRLGVATCCGRCAHSATQVIRHAHNEIAGGPAGVAEAALA